MARACDILIFGSGSFAQRIACDLAIATDVPVRLAMAGRNAPRLAWIATAARARAHMFARPLEVTTHAVDLASAGAAQDLIGRLAPRVVVQAASLQGGAVIGEAGNAWARLVAEGGLSATAVFQAVFSARVARATAAAAPASRFVNGCFPDVVNSMLTAMGLTVVCGIGNIAILAHAFAGGLPPAPRPRRLKMLCHYQNIAAWRRPPAERDAADYRPPRVWLDGIEVADVFKRFAAVQLTAEPVIDISGASGIPLLLAMLAGRDWQGHVPGPLGLPGGYPVAFTGGVLNLDLPDGLAREAAIAWNARHEAECGLTVDADGRAHFTGRLHDALRAESAELAAPFELRDLEAVGEAMAELRQRLMTRRT